MHENRHIQSGETDRVRDPPFVAEVRQRHQDAVDLLPVRLEQIGALLRLGEGFDGAVFRVFRAQGDGVDALLFQHRENGLSPLLAELRGEKTPVAHKKPECRHVDSPLAQPGTIVIVQPERNVSWISGGNDRSGGGKSQGFALRHVPWTRGHDLLTVDVTSPIHQLCRSQNTFVAALCPSC